jgi:transposase
MSKSRNCIGKEKNKRQIARELGLDRRTVRRWLRAASYPERKSTRRSSSLDAHLGYLEGRLQQGCHNAAQLWRDLRERGFGGQPGIVRRWLRQRLGPRAERALQLIQAPPPLRASPAMLHGCCSPNRNPRAPIWTNFTAGHPTSPPLLS